MVRLRARPSGPFRSVVCRSLAWTVCVAAAGGCGLEPYRPGPVPAGADVDGYQARSLTDVADSSLARDLAAGRAGEERPGAWTLGALTRLALARDPAVGAGEAALAAAEARGRAIAVWRDPGLGIGLEHHSLRDEIESTDWSVGPQLTVGMKRASRVAAERAIAAADVAAAKARLKDRVWRVRRGVARAVNELLATRDRRAVNRALIDVLGRAEELASERVRAGLSGPWEKSQLSLAQNRARVEQVALERALVAAEKRLAAALFAGPAGLGTEIELADPLRRLDGEALPELKTLAGLGVTRRADVLTALAAYERADAGVREAVARQYPEFSLTPGFMFDQGDNVWSLMGGAVLPLAVNHRPRVAAAERLRRQRFEEFRLTQTGALLAISVARDDLLAARDALERVATIIADLDAAYAEIRSQRTRGLVDELTRLRAEQEVLAIRAQRVEFEAELRSAQTRLEFETRYALFEPEFANLEARFDRYVEGRLDDVSP